MSIEANSFISEAKDRPKEPIEYERDEMSADISAFSEEARELVQKYLANETLNSREGEIFRNARNEWWQEKYGFPYGQKTARREVISRKYGIGENVASKDMEKRMFEAFVSGSTEDIQKAKAEYSEKYPDQLEGIEVIFALKSFLELSRRLDDPQFIIAHEESKKMFQNLTEHHFLLTHFVKSNQQDKKFMEMFWGVMEKIASDSGLSRNLNIIRKGTVTQVATMRVFEELGMHPQLSHPAEDAFRSIDLWSDESHVVQVKSTKGDEPQFLETESIAFPAVEVNHGGGRRVYNSDIFGQAQKFQMKIEKYRKLVKKPDLKGYFIVIPYSKVDFTTGEPDKALVETLKEKMGGG